MWSRVRLGRAARVLTASCEDFALEALTPEQIERDRLIQRVLRDIPLGTLEARTLKLMLGFGGHLPVTKAEGLGALLGITEEETETTQKKIWEKLGLYVFLLIARDAK